ncbi:hypothetical protein ACER0C_001819 [Sarotherodon galilaeus]
MPKAKCQKCGIGVPLQLLESTVVNLDGDEPTEKECSVLSAQMFPSYFIELHASSCGESSRNEKGHEDTVIEEGLADMPGPSGTSCEVRDGWLTVLDSSKAIYECAKNALDMCEMESPLRLTMDIRQSVADQDMALISFYKRPNVEWARPLECRLEGDTAIGQGVIRFFLSTCMEKLMSGFCINFANSNVTPLFEGEPGHYIPSASHFLVESDMFLMAGRMVGHSFLHGGPCLSGLSPAVVHVLLGGSPETATVTPEDCPDLDLRGTIQLVVTGSVYKQG